MTKASNFAHVQNPSISFADFLQFKGFAIKSIAAHISKMEKLSEFTYEGVMKYVNYLLEAHTKATVNKYVNTSYRLYRKYLLETEQAHESDLSWLDKFKHYKETPKQRVIFSDEELELFLAIDDTYSMYFKLLARTGARPMEIASLQKRDIDFANKILQIQKSKTGDGRTIPIPEDLVQDFYVHLRSHDSSWCFPVQNHEERHITLESLRKSFKRRKKLTGIRQELTPYCLRHTFITRMLGAGIPLFVVQSLVGHKNPNTTRKYFHLNMQMQRDGLRQDPLLWGTLSPEAKLKYVNDYICKLGLDLDAHFRFVRTNDSLQLVIS